MTHHTPLPSERNAGSSGAGGDSAPAETSSVTPQRPGNSNDADTTQIIPKVTDEHVGSGGVGAAGASDASDTSGASRESAKPGATAKGGAQDPAGKPATSRKPATAKKPGSANSAQQRGNAGRGGAALVDVERSITRIDPVSAMKMGFVFNIALFLVWIVAMALVYVVLGSSGVWDKLNSLVGDLTGSDGLTPGLYFAAVAAFGLVEVVVFTLLVPIAAAIYNSAAALFGGIRITLDR